MIMAVAGTIGCECLFVCESWLGIGMDADVASWSADSGLYFGKTVELGRPCCAGIGVQTRKGFRLEVMKPIY
jgi:hypothetical protein